MDRSFEVYEGLAVSARTQEALRRRIDWICGQARGLVLDVGCSQGLVPYLLAQKRHTVVGVDIDAEAIAWAQNKFMHIDEEIRQRIHLYTADFADFQTEQRFDTVIAGEYLEHLNDEQLSVHLRKMALLLKPQGLFVCTTPLGLHPHPVHFQTFFPHSFSQIIGQFFSILFMDVEDGYLRCTGEDVLPRTLTNTVTLLQLTEKGLLQVQQRLFAQAGGRSPSSQSCQGTSASPLSGTTSPLRSWLADRGFQSPFQYDERLFAALNEFYTHTPIASPPPQSVTPNASNPVDKRVKNLLKLLPASKLSRVLEVGCGKGETAFQLSAQSGCHVTGIDCIPYSEWIDQTNSRAAFMKVDLTRQFPFPESQFDFVYSLNTLNRIQQPFLTLEAIQRLLKPGGLFYFTANLYRGPIASNRYREVHFPWPHLLFGDDVFVRYYREQGYGSSGKPAWVNKMAAQQYIDYVTRLGLRIVHCQYSGKPFDESFNACFMEKLGKYPREDLERDFIKMLLIKPATAKEC